MNRVYSLIIVACFSRVLFASDQSMGVSKDTVEEPLTVPEKVSNKPSFLDRQEILISNQYSDLNDALDRLLSSEDDSKNDSAPKKNSYLIMNINSRFEEGVDEEFKVRLKAKVDLPNTKRRWKVIFESTPEEDASPQDNQRVGVVGDENVTQARSLLGLEYLKQRGETQWQPSLDVGARLNFPIDPFIRLTFKKKTKLNHLWMMHFRNDYAHFSREGFKPRAKLEFKRFITDRLGLSVISRYQYTEKEKLEEGVQSVQLNQALSEYAAMEYKVGAAGSSNEDKFIDRYFIQFSYKRRIYSDWMFFSVIPEVVFNGEHDWDSNHALTLQLQAVFAK